MIEPDVRKYHESLGIELQSIKNRVRHLIGNANWGEEGRYKEAIIKDVLRRHLPGNYAIGTGFVLGKMPSRTTQIDVLIYDKSFPVLFREGDFVVISADGVRGIIEVKTKLDSAQIRAVVEKAAHNGYAIYSGQQDRTCQLFNGVFCFECLDAETPEVLESVKIGYEIFKSGSLPQGNYRVRDKELSAVNHLALDKHGFIKLWDAGHRNVKYANYRLPELAAAYFISNLMQFLQPRITSSATQWMYPLDSKEVYKIGEIGLRGEGDN